MLSPCPCGLGPSPCPGEVPAIPPTPVTSFPCSRPKSGFLSGRNTSDIYLLGWFCLCWVGFFLTSSGSIGISYRLGVFVGGFADFCVCFHLCSLLNGSPKTGSSNKAEQRSSGSPTLQEPSSSINPGHVQGRTAGKGAGVILGLGVVPAFPSFGLCAGWFPVAGPPSPAAPGPSGIRRWQCTCPEGMLLPAVPASCFQREPG